MGSFKILHLSSNNTWRGGEQQIAYLLLYSKRLGIDVHVLSRKGSSMSKWCDKNDIPFDEARFRNGLDLSTALKARSLAVKLSSDAVHVHSGKSHSIAYLAVKVGMGTPIIVHRRVDFPLKKTGPSLNKYNHPSVKAVICVSNTIRDMVRRGINDSTKAVTVYSGIDFSRFSYPQNATEFLNEEFGIDNAKLKVANISALESHKDYPTFLKTVKSCRELGVDVHFFIVGSGELEPELKKMASVLDINKMVTFTGFRKDVPAIFQEIDIFLITSSTDELGTTVIDALYHGIPVVATKGGGIPELVRDGQEGFLCELGDAACLSEAIQKLSKDKALRTKLGENAHQRSLLFSSDAMGKGVLEIYKKVLSPKE